MRLGTVAKFHASPLVVGHLRRATTPKAMAYRVREIAERIL